MYTYCTHCNARHKVTAKQLRRHRGLLSCKQCRERFDALAALTDKPDAKLAQANANIFSFSGTKTSPPSARAWWIGSVLMAISLLVQAAYFEGWRVLRVPAVNVWLAAACEQWACSLPSVTDPSDWSVSHSDLQPYIQQYYRFSAALTQQSRISQSLPKLKLTLLGFNGLPIAERVFQPEHYARSLESDGVTREIQLWLAKPQNEIGGFTVTVL